MTSYKTKIFFGTSSIVNGVYQTADLKFNEWIEDHPDIEIIEFKYMQARYGDHSIAILYKEHEKGDI